MLLTEELRRDQWQIPPLPAVAHELIQLANDPESKPAKIVALTRVRGVGNTFDAVLTREVFYRHFDNRGQLASYVGIAPTPHHVLARPPKIRTTAMTPITND